MLVRDKLQCCVATAAAALLTSNSVSLPALEHPADISGNVYQLDNLPTPNTRITVNTTAAGALNVTLDVSGMLLFPAVDLQEAWCVTQGGSPVALTTQLSGQRVLITFAERYTGSVLCTVDQSEQSRRYSVKAEQF